MNLPSQEDQDPCLCQYPHLFLATGESDLDPCHCSCRSIIFLTAAETGLPLLLPGQDVSSLQTSSQGWLRHLVHSVPRVSLAELLRLTVPNGFIRSEILSAVGTRTVLPHDACL